MDLRKKIKNLTWIAILLIVILGWFGLKTDWVADLFGIVILALITSAVAGSLIESSGGGFLKKYNFPFKIWKFKFSVSAFVIAIILIKLLLFR